MKLTHLNVVGLALLCFCLEGCGPPLGKYNIEDVELVDAEQYRKMDAYDRAHIRNVSKLIRIELSSDTDLEAASGEGGGLYALFSFCPYNEAEEHYGIGPFYNDLSPYLPEGGDRKPVRDKATNRFVYTAYFVPTGKTTKESPGIDAEPEYNLYSDKRDVCVKFTSPGYFVTESVSEIVVIPRANLVSAIAQAESKRAPEAP